MRIDSGGWIVRTPKETAERARHEAAAHERMANAATCKKHRDHHTACAWDWKAAAAKAESGQ